MHYFMQQPIIMQQWVVSCNNASLRSMRNCPATMHCYAAGDNVLHQRIIGQQKVNFMQKCVVMQQWLNVLQQRIDMQHCQFFCLDVFLINSVFPTESRKRDNVLFICTTPTQHHPVVFIIKRCTASLYFLKPDEREQKTDVMLSIFITYISSPFKSHECFVLPNV